MFKVSMSAFFIVIGVYIMTTTVPFFGFFIFCAGLIFMCRSMCTLCGDDYSEPIDKELSFKKSKLSQHATEKSSLLLDGGTGISIALYEDDCERFDNFFDSDVTMEMMSVNSFDDDETMDMMSINSFDNAGIMEINPATGLSMIDGSGGDIGGDLYGMDSLDDSCSSLNDSISSFDDSCLSFDDY
jgi:hypothetical protein